LLFFLLLFESSIARSPFLDGSLFKPGMRECVHGKTKRASGCVASCCVSINLYSQELTSSEEFLVVRCVGSQYFIVFKVANLLGMDLSY
jgi:hypothetical protein